MRWQHVNSRKPPVGHTCPDIDALLKDIEDFERTVRNQLEELRKANDALRSWGEEMASDAEREEERADDLEKELKDALKRIADLEADAAQAAKE